MSLGTANDAGGDGEESGAARISDPDNYNLRRRLKQLHDAKERVSTTAERTTQLQLADRSFTTEQRDRLVAEAVANYAVELLSILRIDESDVAEEFLAEEVATVEDEMRTIEEIHEGRGVIEFQVDDETKTGIIPYEVSMQAYGVCNEFFDRVAGPEFDGEMPKQRQFDTTRPEDRNDE